MKDKDVLCHNGANRTDGKPAEGLLRGQGSPRLFQVHVSSGPTLIHDN